MARNGALVGALVLGMLVAGCESARHVKTERDGGVIAIPSNSNSWPSYYRNQAETLMRKQCPHGFEIVKEEEAVTGTVTHSNTNTHTKPPPSLVLGGEEESSRGDKKRERSSSTFAGVAIPLGEERQTVDRTTTVNDVTEWRIHYRPREASPAPAATTGPANVGGHSEPAGR